MWLCWVFIALHTFSVVVASRGYSSLWCMGFSCCGAGSRLRASALVAKGLSGCGSQAMESYPTRDQTRFLCISRILILFSHTPSAGGRFGMSLCISVLSFPGCMAVCFLYSHVENHLHGLQLQTDREFLKYL